MIEPDASKELADLRMALETLEGAPDIGAVGGKLILADGSLQEAGCIVWRDGSCLGYGRGGDPTAAAFFPANQHPGAHPGGSCDQCHHVAHRR